MDLFDTFFGELLMTPHCQWCLCWTARCNSGRYSRPALPPSRSGGCRHPRQSPSNPLSHSFAPPHFWLAAQIQLGWTENRLAGAPAHLKGRIVKKYRTIGLIILVAIPLPGTGAWTGALVADVLDLRLRTALPAIALGVLIAGIITTTVTCGVIRVFW